MGRTTARFLERYYWRVETRGLEQVPREGPAMLVGIHRGFMPFDGFLAAHLIARETGRVPRFLIHPGLVKFPFLHDFMTKQGGMIASNENADYVLQRDDLLAIYPEGIHGAFRYYRDAYRLGKFGRDEYVRMALRNRAPLVPFVTIGPAEIYPILAKFEWSWWKRYSEWPCFPITPTFPLLPVPLPAKWHTLVLEPLHVERQYPVEAAEDDGIVQAIGRDVRARLDEAMTWMRGRRRSIFFGSIFGDNAFRPTMAVGSEAESVTAIHTS
jgi:1-acyl-sn-glycerol-3-phosphate acyltransferase